MSNGEELPPRPSADRETKKMGPRDVLGAHERERALKALETEAAKPNDRIAASHGERVRRMRSSEERRVEKQDVQREERLRRINILLRKGAYDRNRLQRMPDGDEKREIESWMSALTPAERQRLYVIGRKKIDFKIRREPEHEYAEGDTEEIKKFKDEKFERYKIFQEEQKELADALEVVAVPMLRSTLERMGKPVDVYIASSNDDIAGGLDIVIDFKKPDGTPELFEDGTQMKFVVDVTYARMGKKATIDLARGRISDEAYAILKGPNKQMPYALSNARAMKLFRTVVETLGGHMSTQTFGKNGPLALPQVHVPRLIVGLDWKNAFAGIANWVEAGDDFEAQFKGSRLSQEIGRSIRKQLLGLHDLAKLSPDNPNTPFLTQLIDALNIKSAARPGVGDDDSLENINRLLTLDTDKAIFRDRLYRAALAQIQYNETHGAHVRGDHIELPRVQTTILTEKMHQEPEVPKSAMDSLEPGRRITRDLPSMYFDEEWPEAKGTFISTPATVESKPEIKVEVSSPPLKKDAQKALRDINAAWKNSKIDEHGERVVWSKNRKEFIHWGDFLVGRMANLNGPDRAALRPLLPMATPKSAEIPDSVRDFSKQIAGEIPSAAELVQAGESDESETSNGMPMTETEQRSMPRASSAEEEERSKQEEIRRIKQRLAELDLIQLRRRIADAQKGKK